jgi:hypothetical protein
MPGPKIWMRKINTGKPTKNRSKSATPLLEIAAPVSGGLASAGSPQFGQIHSRLGIRAAHSEQRIRTALANPFYSLW